MNALTNSQKMDGESLLVSVQQAEQQFVARFAKPPQWIVAAPGRVNLIGEHTDYNDGFVLPMAIERYTILAASLTTSTDLKHRNQAVFHSSCLEESFDVALDQPLEPGPSHWSNYVQGVVAGFLDRGNEIPSFEAMIHSSVPLGGGLSSSAALEVATATLLEAILNVPLEPAEKAILCQQAEHRFAGVPCGIMDQFSSVFAQENALMLLDCRSEKIEPIPFASPDVTILITNSNIRHELADGEYALRRQQCQDAAKALGVSSLRDATIEKLETASEQMDEVLFRRARHVITENARTLEAAAAIREKNWSIAGQRMYASHESLRGDYQVSCEELDLLVEIAKEIGVQGGVFGSRLTGGGFGGCTVSLVKTDSARTIAETLCSRYTAKTGIEPCLFASRPARGAHVIPMKL